MTFFLCRARKLFLLAALLYSCVVGVGNHLRAQARARFPILPEQVLSAMQDRDWPTRNVQVQLPSAVTAAVVSPVLEVASVSPAAGHEIMLRVTCHVHTECLPFFVLALWPVAEPVPNLLAGSQNLTRPVSREHLIEPEVTIKSEISTNDFNDSRLHDPALIRVGSPATLMLNKDRIHIRIHVMFAESGHVGDTVRVTTPDRKQTYVADVLTPELLQGDL